MGFSIGSIVDSFTGGSQVAKAAQQGSDAQVAYGNKAIDFQKESRDQARADLQPYSKVGADTLPGLASLVNDPNAQKSFIEDNPFFKALSDQATNTLFSNQAARGKVGSGGTAAALQNSLLLLGTDLLNQNITQKQNLVNAGQNAAAGQGAITQNASNAISDTYLGQGNSIAAGKIAGANAIQSGRQGLLGAGMQAGGTALGMIAACDRRLKTDIEEVGRLNNGLPLYKFRYKGNDKIHINVMAQDVEKVKPEAIIEIDGYKHVNLEKVCQ